MVSLNVFSRYEREQMVLKLLKQKPFGMTATEISKNFSISRNAVTKILKGMEQKKMIKVLVFGHANLYKVIGG